MAMAGTGIMNSNIPPTQLQPSGAKAYYGAASGGAQLNGVSAAGIYDTSKPTNGEVLGQGGNRVVTNLGVSPQKVGDQYNS